VLNLITSVNFLCNYAYTELQASTLRPWFRDLDLRLGLEICGLGLEHVGLGLDLGLDTTGLIPITGPTHVTVPTDDCLDSPAAGAAHCLPAQWTWRMSIFAAARLTRHGDGSCGDRRCGLANYCEYLSKY